MTRFRCPRLYAPVPFIAVLLLLPAAARADLLELLSGSRVEGQVVARDEKSITIQTTVGERAYTRKWPTDKIHAVTVDGKREVLNAKAEDGPGARPKPGPGTPKSGGAQRSRAEIEKLIDESGRTPPDWFDSVPLDFPKTLDLSWPEPAPGGWNSQRNVGQYVWDVINTNPGKYREGVRFMHHLLSVSKDQPKTQLRAMNELGRMYHNLVQDHARAAFWWRKAGVEKGSFPGQGVPLAECYWRLGSKQMALDLLDRLPPQYAMIKLWADMGETRRALQMAEANARGDTAFFAWTYAGDACRVAGQYQQALQYYQKVLQVRADGLPKGMVGLLHRSQRRAQMNSEAIRLFDTLDLRRVADGAYRGSSLGFEADVVVEVVVKSGCIESVKVTQHKEKQYYAAMTDTPRKIIEKQSVKGIDATSSATITSDAIVNATAKALSGAMK